MKARVLRGDFRNFKPVPVSSDISVGAWCELDLRQQVAAGAQPFGLRRAFGPLQELIPDSPLRELTSADVIGLLKLLESQTDELGQPRFSSSSLHFFKGMWAGAFGRALAQGVITNNPCRGLPHRVIAPKAAERDTAAEVLDAEQMTRILSSPRIDALRRGLWAALLLTGARVGEICALRFEDIRRGTPLDVLVISKSWSPKLAKVKSTKTGATREVPVHPVLRGFLDELEGGLWREHFGKAPTEGDLIFPRLWQGKLRHLYQGVVLENWHKDLRAVGLAPRRAHATRHSFLSAMVAAGVETDRAMAMTHGTDKSSMADTYRHWSWSSLCEAVAKLPVERIREPEQMNLFPPITSPLFPSIVDLYRNQEQRAGRCRNTPSTDRIVEHLSRIRRPIHEVRGAHLREVFDRMREKNNAPKTILAAFTFTRKLFAHSIRTGLVECDPLAVGFETEAMALDLPQLDAPYL